MGASSPNEKGYIIWIDKNINIEENKKYKSYFLKQNYKVETFDEVKSGLKQILSIKKNFKDIYVILSSSYYQKFIIEFKRNLKDIYVVPKIVIFTRDKEMFLDKNSNIKDIIKNSFYNLGGIQIKFNGVMNEFLTNKTWKKNYDIKDKSLKSNTGEQYTFEQINNILELFLPVFYKGLIKLNENDILVN